MLSANAVRVDVGPTFPLTVGYAASDGPGEYVVSVLPEPGAPTDVVAGSFELDAMVEMSSGPLLQDATPYGVRACGSMFRLPADALRVGVRGGVALPSMRCIIALSDKQTTPRWQAVYDRFLAGQSTTPPAPIPRYAYAWRVTRQPLGTAGTYDMLDGALTSQNWQSSNVAITNIDWLPVPAAAVYWSLTNSATTALWHSIAFKCGVPE